VDDVVVVGEELIEEAVYRFANRQKTVVEGAGAAALAAVMGNRDRFEGRKVGLVLSGGNIDPRMLASVMIRGLERDDKIVSLRLTIFDQPGTLGRIASLLGDAGANILSISHRRILLNVPARGSILDVMIETKNAQHSEQVVQHLKERGYDVVRVEKTSVTDFVTN
jgi:threonine dehydratase